MEQQESAAENGKASSSDVVLDRDIHGLTSIQGGDVLSECISLKSSTGHQYLQYSQQLNSFQGSLCTCSSS